MLKKAGQTGKFLLLCVDSDYDYLLDNESIIYDNPYIFQTYTYSFENHLCNPLAMEMMCIHATLSDNIDFDFVAFFENYSHMIYPLFIYHLSLKLKYPDTSFTIDKFCEIISLPNKFNIKELENKLQERLKRDVEKKLHVLNNDNEHFIDEQQLTTNAQKWEQLGLNKNNAYLFINGHFLFQTTLNILEQVCYPLRTKKINDFWLNVKESHTKKVREKESVATKAKVVEYEKSLMPVEFLLLTNKMYQQNILLEKLQQAIRSHIQIT